MKSIRRISVFLIFIGLLVSCGESLMYKVERVVPAKDRPVFSSNRVEGEDCVGLVIPFMFGRFVPEIERAYANALEKAPPGTQSLSNGEVFTRGFILPPLVFFRCIVVTGTPSMD
ncbi:hypothetical protein EHQ27_15460 [Leptospira wolffii]|uniref:hypothetical protein n=1 Tax=Leptospira wolffii TaxID=409998 RepID=UPI001084037A|nr:hypothetical protein [Leptospira wolffii]TGK58772.1 hypothetical protein EHQ32_12035 [Leptospira wolffii]TGK67559.1 hypothetical protein EHQ27_15460 [Leptospira wolffii]TGK72680.1 hypothetical protein EHQ35_11105 [Leptospira wolffii]TGL26871.1 hypothetical protein EHQ57_17580 [Leptospira wolffii]